MNNEPVYYLESGQLAKLYALKRALYGDGSTLNPDTRRDLANMLDAMLDSIERYQQMKE